MINVTIKGACVSYETLKDAQTASTDQGLAFWRETLEICERDDGAWNDLLNELSDSGGESEAETLDEIFCSPAMRRWVLVALVLNGLTDSDYGQAIKDIANKDYDQLINWLECRKKTHEGADAASVKAELAYWQGIVDHIHRENESAIAKRKAEDAKKRREREEKQRAEAERIRLEEEQKKAARAEAVRRKREREAEERAEAERARQEMVRVAVAQAEAERQRKEQEEEERKRMFHLWATATYVTFDLAKNEGSFPIAFFTGEMPAGRSWKDEFFTTKLLLRRVEAGTFMMGSPHDEIGRWDDELFHQVRITEPFYMGVCPITYCQWCCICKLKPVNTDFLGMPMVNTSYEQIRGSNHGATYPETRQVDEDSFLFALRKRTGCFDFDLPTEAQWEYACRAGTTTRFSEGDHLYDWNSNHGHMRTCTTKIGTFFPNNWGLYDMHGNVREWCLDWYGLHFNMDLCFGSHAIDIPIGEGCLRVVRGGGWISDESMCRSAARDREKPDTCAPDLGFRVCCSAESVLRMNGGAR